MDGSSSRKRRRALLVLAAAALATAQPATAAPAPSRWCGGAGVPADRPDVVSAFQVHVLYAVPADAPDRFTERALPIARDLAAVDGWWQGQDVTRAPRFDFASFAGCDSAFGALDLSDVRLPGVTARYAGPDYGYGALTRDLGFELAEPEKKYLVFFDASLLDPRVCGTSTSEPLLGGRNAFAVVYLGSTCAGVLGDATDAATTAAHELVHDLGALVQPGPPHACRNDAGHPCDDRADILFPYATPGTPLAAKVLDSGRDDYYGHSGSWWDVQDSPFLVRLDSADRTPPAGPAAVSATSRGSTVTVSWPAATDGGGPVSYRAYKGDDLLAGTNELSASDHAPEGATITYSVRAVDGAGFLGPRLSVRFTVGLGIVDGDGLLVRDTVPPPPVEHLYASVERRRVTLSWGPVSDRGGMRGYRLERNGRAFGRLETRSPVVIPRAEAKGAWRVLAVDRAGNVGPPGPELVVR